jgi:lipopolysaccharide export system protein LptC
VIKLARTAWEYISLYLPAILMGVLALGTYWLVRSTPLVSAPEQEPPARHEPDYFMNKFSVKTFAASGRLKSEVKGAEARHYPDTNTLEIDLVKIRSFNAEGSLIAATANHALTSGDASEVQLFGAAQVMRDATPSQSGQPQPRIEFRSEYLHAFMATERIKSDQPVELIRGKARFTADTLDYDKLERVLQLKGHVKGLLVPEVTH